MSFTAVVRDELAHVPIPDGRCRLAETATALRLGGTLRLRGGTGERLGVVVTTPSRAVARRLHTALRTITGERPTIEVHEADGIRRHSSVVLHLDTSAAALQTLGILDRAGRPSEHVAPGMVRRRAEAEAALRGALMTAGSVSDPRREPHLEVRAPGPTAARDVMALLRRCGAARASTSPHAGGWRVVVKSGPAIGTLLARAGAHTAFLEWDQGRLRRELRAAANRAANADRANLSRAVAASARQVATIEQLVAARGWDELPDDLRDVALARLANPEASLTELGALLDPPLGKAAVHRRIGRLQDLARNGGDADR
jgi:cell division protein WhiA